MSQSLESVLALSGEARLEALVRLADDLTQAADAGETPDCSGVVDALLAVISSGEGASKLRMAAGEALGRLGDPRVVGPDHDDYWAQVELDLGTVKVGRFPVTISEWQAWVDEGAYERDDHWDEEALAWRDSAKRLWPALAARESVRHLVIRNQPVVGVSWYEARAYARRHGGRLLSFGERMQVARGDEKRPYPWGAPFGSGNANTREEVLGKPCAVGLFQSDKTPDGIYDLAGNVAEWTADRVDDACVVHPGSWEQPSMASWAKARELEPARSRGADLGFRIARDVE